MKNARWIKNKVIIMHLIDMILDFSPTISKKTLKNACAIFKKQKQKKSVV